MRRMTTLALLGLVVATSTGCECLDALARFEAWKNEAIGDCLFGCFRPNYETEYCGTMGCDPCCAGYGGMPCGGMCGQNCCNPCDSGCGSNCGSPCDSGCGMMGCNNCDNGCGMGNCATGNCSMGNCGTGNCGTNCAPNCSTCTPNMVPVQQYVPGVAVPQTMVPQTVVPQTVTPTPTLVPGPEAYTPAN